MRLLHLLFIGLLVTAGNLAGDTIWGPKSYTLGTPPLDVWETVTTDIRNTCGDKAAYVLSVQNGTSQSGALVTGGTVSMNGQMLVRLDQLPSAARSVELPFVAQANNTVEVNLTSGKAGASIIVGVSKTSQEKLRETTYTLTGKSNSFRDTIAGSNTSQYVIVAESGVDGGSKPTSVSISVNGTEIVRTTDLAYYPARKAVSLAATNTVDVALRGNAGGNVWVAFFKVAPLSSCPPFIGLNITYPSAGSTVDSRYVGVEGTAFGPQDVQVFVNDAPAIMDLSRAGTQQDPFTWRSDLFLPEGDSLLRATASTAGGPTPPVSTSSSLTVRLPPEAASIRVVPESGVAPLAVAMSLLDTTRTGVTRVELDFEGDGVFDMVGDSYPADVQHQYAAPGTYTPTLRISSTSGSTLLATASVRVMSLSDVAQEITARWNLFRDRLAQQDVEGAVGYMTSEARERYRPALAAIGSRLPAFAASLGFPRLSSLDGTTAKLMVIRNIDGADMGHWIVFQRTEDGIWLLSQF